MRKLALLALSLGCSQVVAASGVRLMAPETPTSFSRYVEIGGEVYGPGDYEVLAQFEDTLLLESGSVVETEELIGSKVRELGGDGVAELEIVLPELGEYPVQDSVRPGPLGCVSGLIQIALSYAVLFVPIGAVNCETFPEICQPNLLYPAIALLVALSGLVAYSIAYVSLKKTKLVIRGKVVRLKRK